MSKPVINNRVIYNNLLGRIAQHDIFVNQGVTTGDSPTFNDIFILGDASITGNLYVEGNTTILNTNVLEFEDNVILINRLETGAGVTLNQSGLEVERGTLENYRMVFNESDDTFRVGLISNTQAVATREDNPLTNGVMIWNNTTKRLDSRNTIDINLIMSSTTNATSSSTGALAIAGGLGVNKDIYTSSKIYIRGNDNNNNSILWTDTSNSFNLTTPGAINITPTTKVVIPYDKPLTFGNDNNKIVVSSANNKMEIANSDDINFTLGFGKRITVPNGIPITFSTQNEKVYADDSNNIVVTSSQDVNLTPGVGKRVFLGFDVPIAFGNSNQKIYGTLIEDLYVKAGNNIVLSPSALQNVVIPTDNGIRFGNSGLQRIYANSNSELFVNSTNDITFSVTSNNINITGPTHLNFGNANQYIYGETGSGTLFLAGSSIKTTDSSIVTITSTKESTNSGTGAFIVNGGVGVSKNLNIGGNVVVGGDLTVSGVTTTLNTETVLIEDNLLVINSGPSPLSDGGLLVKKFQSGTTGTTDYAGIFYKQSDNRFLFANTLADPGKNDITITNYLPATAFSLNLISTENAIGVGSGGALSIIQGGANIQKDLWLGGNLYLPNSNYIYLQNTNGNTASIQTETIAGGALNIFSDNSIKLNSGNGTFSFWNNNVNLLNVDTVGRTILSATANAIGLGSGGNLTILGGCSIGKDIYIGGKSVMSNTTPSTNMTSASFVLFGGISIANQTNSTYGNGGAVSIAGGVYIGKDLYISGNIYSNNSINELFALTLTSTQPAYSNSYGSLINNGGILIRNSTNATSLTYGGSLLSYGGASINKDLRVGGDLYLTGSATLNSKLNLTGGVLFQSVTNNSSTSNLWTYLGKLDKYCKLTLNERDIKTDVDLSLTNNTTANFSYSLIGNQLNNRSHIYVYKNGNEYNVFLNTLPLSSVNLHVLNKDGTPFQLATEGTGVTPNGTTSGYTGTWTENWTTKNETNMDISVGDTYIQGQLSMYDNVPIIGSQDTNSVKVSGRDLGVILQRYQESNDTGSGDTVGDTPIFSQILPLQTTATSTQVIFDNSANSSDNYYLNWWVRTSNNQVRKIIGYNGAQRVAQLDIAWTTPPVIGDTLIFYNTQLVGMYWDESDRKVSFSYVARDNDTLLNNGNIGLRCENVYLTGTTASSNASTGNIYSLGGISIANTTDSINCSNGGSLTTLGGVGVGKSLFVGNRVYIGARSTSPNDSFTINQTTSSIALFNTTGSYSSLLFAGDGTNKKYGVVNDNSNNLFSITYSSGTETPNNSAKSLVINSSGNIGLKTTENMNALLTLAGGNYISANNDNTFLGLRGSINETSGSRVILNGNGSGNLGDIRLYSGGDSGRIRLYTKNIERANVDQNGILNILTTNVSSNGSSGSVVLSGGISISSTTNASASTNGGSFTTDGGMGVKRDMYIGGDLYVDGTINTIGGVTAPNIIISNTSNCTILTIENSSLIKINNQIMYSVSVVLNPLVSSTLTEFQFALPQRVAEFTKINEANIQCSGFTGDETTLFNTTGVAVLGTTRCKIKLQSASTGVHYIQLMCRYSI